jgi:hypothetical protein
MRRYNLIFSHLLSGVSPLTAGLENLSEKMSREANLQLQSNFNCLSGKQLLQIRTPQSLKGLSIAGTPGFATLRLNQLAVRT